MNKFTPPLPDDLSNRSLIENVHPPNWTNPTPQGRYNLVVVGGGTAGLVAAAGAAGLGARVALVERALMGGDCLNVGCVPSKAILRSSHAAAEIRDAARFGVHVASAPQVDFTAVMQRMRAVRAGISPHDSARRFTDHYGVDVFFGDARFVSRDTVEVAGATLRFSRAVIATGARAAVPSIPGLREAGYLTNETVFELTELPLRLAVLGAGPIGCELAQAFARLGSRVTLIERLDRALPRENPAAARVVLDALAADAIDVRLETSLEAVTSGAAGKALRVEGHAGPAMLEVDAILVAVGRIPNLEGLGLEAAGVASDRSGVRVDDTLRTSNPRIYASGDVCLAHRFTHVADAASRAVVQNALFPGPKKRISRLVVPWCTYTDPELAHVGLTAAEAAAQGVALDTIRIEMSEVDRAVAEGDTRGFLEVHLKAGTDTIRGATLVGRHAGEIISEITTAMVAGRGLGSLAAVIHPYPTRAEIVRKAADAFNRTRLSPTLAAVLRRWFAWRR